MTGAFEAPDKHTSFYTGLTKKEVADGKKALKTKMVFMDGWVVVLNARKYNNYASNSKQSMAYMKEYGMLPDVISEYVEAVDAPDYVGGYKKNKSGYLHRNVAESLLGRKLSEDEVVHHIDLNPENNNPDNLAVMLGDTHTLLHQGKVDISDTGIILLSEYYDTNHKSETINPKSETLKKKEYTKVSDITDVDITEIAEKYGIKKDFVRQKLDDLENWIEEKPTRGKGRNLRRTLMAWVKRDAEKMVKEHFSKNSRGGVVDVREN